MIMEIEIPRMDDPTMQDISQGDGLCVGVWGRVISATPDTVVLDADKIAVINANYTPGGGDTEGYGEEGEEEAATPTPTVPAGPPPAALATMMRGRRALKSTTG